MYKNLQSQLQKLGWEVIQVDQPQKGYRNQSYKLTTKDGDALNLIIYKQEEGIIARIKRANLISDALANRGYATREAKTPLLVVKAGEGKPRYACIYNYLPGETIPWEAYTQKHLKVMGEALSNMHKSILEIGSEYFNNAGYPDAVAELDILLGVMTCYFSEAGVISAMQKKLALRFSNRLSLEGFSKLLIQLRTETPASVLHLDFVRSNVLFTATTSGPKISGILDFEKAAYGPQIIDIARTLAFLIVDCKYKPEQKVRKYFLHSGYNKRGSQDLPNLRLLDNLLLFFWAHDFYKFLCHNPYESLAENEHYQRTIALLLERGVLERV